MTDNLEIILQDDVRSIFETFSNLLGVRIAFMSRIGREMSSAKGMGASSLCSFIRQDLGLLHQCRLCDDEKRVLCANTRQTLTYKCHAGLTESIAPIYALDELIGFIMIGQIRSSRKISKTLLGKCANVRQRVYLQKVFDNQPYIDSIRLKNILRLFSLLVGYIIKSNLISIKRNLILSKALTYIESNMDKAITLNNVALHCGRSRSTITHLFSREMKKSFRRYVIDKKLDRAETILKERPELSIGEVADSLSFCDQFYFSKIYKKIKGTTPSKSR